MSAAAFHPAVAAWFEATFARATPVQSSAWREIRTGGDVLIAAPTGSGKTLAAFLCALDELVRESRRAPLRDGVQVLYISPLKALSNDIERNLEAPLAGIEARLADGGEPRAGIRAAVRTGDTPPGEREKMRRRPPQVLVTTPESLYLLLTSASGRAMLGGVRHVIVDEIHALAGSKRGSHLALSLARLDALAGARPRRIGLSATQKPIDRMAAFLCGGGRCAIVDTGHQRRRDLELVLPESPLTPVMANEVWEEVHDALENLIEAHRTTLIFVNTRRLSERLARHLSERLGEDAVTAHHGSLSRAHRLEAEQALKRGRLRALVATASLELGIDIGHVDLVCQLGSPGSIAALLQRVGRAGHAVDEIPKGRLFPLTRDDLAECVALLRSVAADTLDAIRIPDAPLDVLAQQLVAELAAREWPVDGLFDLVRGAWPYRDLRREDFDAVLRMLAEGFSTRRGRRGAFVHLDAVNGVARARRAAKLAALQNGGAIPDHFDYEVTLLPQGHRIGTLNEDFAFESVPGDIFQLGNTSYRVLKVEQGRVLVEDAHGEPPNIPFWFGERPGRTDELSTAVSALREESEERLAREGVDALERSLRRDGVPPPAAAQLAAYLGAAHGALGCLPTRRRIVLERFFDDTGDMHLVIHAPLGSRLMRAWGLALRKRFCRRFNFELQAAALEDCLILSLGETHSFALDEVPAYLHADSVREVLVQALLDAPLFEVRWRWCATTALAVQRMRNGRRVPPQWQRNAAEDLVAVVFPDQIACLENIQGAREVPDHPLVRQTIGDCLHDSMDIAGLERLLTEIRAGEIEVVCRDLTAPSPLAAEIINARPYAFLDDGEAENRRTRAIRQAPNDLGDAARLRILSRSALERVRDEAWLRPRDAEELHDGLLVGGFLTGAEARSGVAATGAATDATGWGEWFKHLVAERRACRATLGDAHDWWLASERVAEFRALHPQAVFRPDPTAVLPQGDAPQRDEALNSLLRSRLSALGPVTAERLAQDFALTEPDLAAALTALEGEGFVIRMDEGDGTPRWCERRLLARIHRYSRETRRREARPVSPAAYLAFLQRWHGLEEPAQDAGHALSLLEGWSAPTGAWVTSLLPARCAGATVDEMDRCFLSGRHAWFRAAKGDGSGSRLVSASPITVVARADLARWRGDAADSPLLASAESAPADTPAFSVIRALEAQGALFTGELARACGLSRPRLERALRSAIAEGRVTADALSPLTWLLRSRVQRRRHAGRRGAVPLGRWSLLETPSVRGEARATALQQALAAICSALLRRYGVVFRAVLARETGLPPWRLLLSCFRRLEDRGEVHGGRFVDGFSGEQFAAVDAVGALRQGGDDALRAISACDPLNLGGHLVQAPRTPAAMANRIVLRAGLPVARACGERIEWLVTLGRSERERAEVALGVFDDGLVPSTGPALGMAPAPRQNTG